MTKQREAPELGAAAVRMMRALVRRAAEGEYEALEQLAMLGDAANLELGVAVVAYRANYAMSWTHVGTLLGSTRQNAQQRFSKPGFRTIAATRGLL